MNHVHTIEFVVRCSSAYHLRTCNRFHFVRKCGIISESKMREERKQKRTISKSVIGNFPLRLNLL